MGAPLAIVRAAVHRLPPDAVLAGCLLAAAQVELMIVGPTPHRTAATVSAFALTLPFVWWHRWPLLPLASVMATLVVQTAIGVPPNAQVVLPLAWALGSFGAAAYGDRRVAVLGLLVVGVPIGVLVVADVIPSLSDLLWVATIFTMAPWITGRVYRARRAEAVAYARRAALAEAEGERRAREVLETERRRIARELHDIIAHSLSLMVLHAGAASEVLERSPGRAREALDTVQDAGRQALVEMKRLLAVLRTTEGAGDLQPQPGLQAIPPLVDQMRHTGLDIRLTMDLDSARAPAAIELSAYRVVQEALTNVIKHADARHVQVDVRADRTSVEVEVVDDGAPAAGAGNDTGHGLVGMRERVALYQGKLEVGPAKHGFRVRASFPYSGREQP
jgi:signal transduction histidine kinase